MADHYYTSVPTSEHRPARLRYLYRGAELTLDTDSGVFSRTEIDRGTDILLRALPETMTGDVLDMGCGYGVVGVAVGKRYPACRIAMADVNQRACGLARENAKSNGVSARVWDSDGYANVPPGETFDFILQNPPIRAGKAVIYQMFAQGSQRLRENGSLWLVIRKQQGAPSAVTYLQSLFHQVLTVTKESGYWVLQCAKPIEQKQEAGQTP